MKPIRKRRNKRGKKRLKNVDKRQANHARATEAVDSSLFLSLPVHLIFDIVVRLPICTLLICKHVCHALKGILSDPDFTHLAKASLDDYHLVIQKRNNMSEIFLTPLCYVDKHALYSQTDNHFDGKFLPWHTLNMPTLIPKAKKNSFRSAFLVKKNSFQSAFLVGSCNGLLCLRYDVNEVIYFCICNPILGEFTVLPQFIESSKWTLQLGGFGFCPKTKQYKVLRFMLRLRYCDILTLGIDDDWRRISDAPPYPHSVNETLSSFHGYLHWFMSKTSICCFNLETELYSYMSTPSFLKNTNDGSICSLEIGTLDGLFCVSFIIYPGQFEVYVMEDYEGKGSWISRVSVHTGYDFVSLRYDMTTSTVRFLDNGVLVLRHTTHLVYYDTRKGTTSDILVKGDCHALVHIPSLISLEDIVKRENVEQAKRKMLHIFSLKASKRQSH